MLRTITTDISICVYVYMYIYIHLGILAHIRTREMVRKMFVFITILGGNRNLTTSMEFVDEIEVVGP